MNTTPASVLVIEAHPMMRSALCSAIAAEPDLKVIESNILAGESLTLAIMDDILFLPSKPDIILLALGTPGHGGLEVLRALQNFLTDTPILVLTSNEVPGQEQAAFEAGAQVVLTKAVSRSELIQALRELRMKAFIYYSKNKLEQEANENISYEN